MNHQDVIASLEAAADPQRVADAKRFFKTGPGQYSESDRFIGVNVPTQRRIAKAHQQLPLPEAQHLLHSPIHEHRLTALLILVYQHARATPTDQRAIYELYLANTQYINNWDLVDTSAEYIVGPHPDAPLEQLATSADIWERRIAMVACFHDIKRGRSQRAFAVIDLLQNDHHDLIRKAVGWMLREIGKRCSRAELTTWLRQSGRYRALPRVTLRYAIEHLAPEVRQAYLKGTIDPL